MAESQGCRAGRLMGAASLVLFSYFGGLSPLAIPKETLLKKRQSYEILVACP